MLKYIIQKQNSVIPFTSNNPIRTHKCACRSSVFCSRDQECFIISSKPILASPSMIKVIMALPTINTTQLTHVFAMFTDNYMSALFDITVAFSNICGVLSDLHKQRPMKI